MIDEDTSEREREGKMNNLNTIRKKYKKVLGWLKITKKLSKLFTIPYAVIKAV